jgi:hypothetical protein
LIAGGVFVVPGNSRSSVQILAVSLTFIDSSLHDPLGLLSDFITIVFRCQLS